MALDPGREITQTNLRNLEAYLSANPSLSNQSQQTPEPEQGNNLLQTLIGGLQGAFNEDQTGDEAIADFLIGLIPIIGQLVDGRDLAAYLYRIVFKRQYNDPLNWVGLALTLVGLVPIVGDLAKFLGKTVVRGGLSALGSNLDDVLKLIRSINPGFVDDIAQLKGLLAQNWGKGVQAALDRWNTALGQLLNWANGIPDLLFSQQKRQLIEAIFEVKSQSDKMLSQAFDQIRRHIDEALDEIGRRINPNGQLVTPEGVRLPSDEVDEATQGPLRIEGGTGGSSLNPSVARFLNLEEIQNLEVVYREALEQNSKLAAEFAKVRSRSQTAAQNRARALANNDQTNLRQAEKLSREAAADAARLERKLVETGILRNGIRYKPEPELLGNNKHGLEWEGGPRRLAETGNPQGRFGSLADIQFAVDKAAQLGAGREDFFDLLPGNSSFVYKYKDDIIGGEVITVPARRVYVKVRNNGVVHAYPLE